MIACERCGNQAEPSAVDNRYCGDCALAIARETIGIRVIYNTGPVVEIKQAKLDGTCAPEQPERPRPKRRTLKRVK